MTSLYTMHNSSIFRFSQFNVWFGCLSHRSVAVCIYFAFKDIFRSTERQYTCVPLPCHVYVKQSINLWYSILNLMIFQSYSFPIFSLIRFPLLLCFVHIDMRVCVSLKNVNCSAIRFIYARSKNIQCPGKSKKCRILFHRC